MATRKRKLSVRQVQWVNPPVTVTGQLLRKEPLVYGGKPMTRYVIKDEHETLSCLGTTQLDEAMSSIEAGERVEILYTGSQKTSNNRTVKVFEVFLLEDEEKEGES